jgi:hypothetical protein
VSRPVELPGRYAAAAERSEQFALFVENLDIVRAGIGDKDFACHRVATEAGRPLQDATTKVTVRRTVTIESHEVSDIGVGHQVAIATVVDDSYRRQESAAGLCLVPHAERCFHLVEYDDPFAPCIGYQNSAARIDHAGLWPDQLLASIIRTGDPGYPAQDPDRGTVLRTINAAEILLTDQFPGITQSSRVRRARPDQRALGLPPFRKIMHLCRRGGTARQNDCSNVSATPYHGPMHGGSIAITYTPRFPAAT